MNAKSSKKNKAEEVAAPKTQFELPPTSLIASIGLVLWIVTVLNLNYSLTPIQELYKQVSHFPKNKEAIAQLSEKLILQNEELSHTSKYKTAPVAFNSQSDVLGAVTKSNDFFLQRKLEKEHQQEMISYWKVVVHKYPSYIPAWVQYAYAAYNGKSFPEAKEAVNYLKRTSGRIFHSLPKELQELSE